MPTNPQIEVEEDDMLTQQRRNFEADQAKGDGHLVRTTFFDYDFSQKKSAKKSGKNASLWRRILSCHHKNKQSGTAALLEVQAITVYLAVNVTTTSKWLKACPSAVCLPHLPCISADSISCLMFYHFIPSSCFVY